MDFTSLPLFDVLRARMSWLNARQGVLAQNVANSDVPGYTASDLKPLDFQRVLESAASQSAGSLATDNPMHIGASSGFNAGSLDLKSFESNSAGQTVDPEEEMMKVSDTQAQYQAAANLYAKAVGMMRTAIGNP